MYNAQRDRATNVTRFQFQISSPRIPKEIRNLIRQMSQENPTWGAPRIQSELKLLGYEVVESTVAKYMITKRNRLHKHGELF